MKTKEAPIHKLIIAVGMCYVVLLCACSSGDDLTVTTESNASADNGGENGAAINISATSADGSQTVDVQSGASSNYQTQFRYETPTNAVHTFCLKAETEVSTATLLDANGAFLLSLESDSCAAIELNAGTYRLIVNPSESVFE